MTESQKERDREALWNFIAQMKKENSKHAVLIVPYGEALVHAYYWRAMAELSQIELLEYIGCQTNFSFPVEKMLGIYEECHGKKEKLRLWCTFHPSMTTIERFVEQCRKLEVAGIAFSVGMVGNPEEIPILLELRKQLPDSIYVWINKMDGRKESYTTEELEIFQKVDPYFPLQMEHRKADLQKCRQSVFYEADGSKYFCNLHAASKGKASGNGCGRRECNCYLAYSNRTDVEELLFFQPYPAFRIPSYPKAIFLDVDGTIVKEGEQELTDVMAEQLRRLSKKSKIFLATELPYLEAMRKCRKIKECLSGGVFAGGGHIRIQTENNKVWEQWIPLADIFSMEQQKIFEKKYQVKVRKYQHNSQLYRQTLITKKKEGWLKDELEQLKQELKKLAEQQNISYILHPEKRHLGITGENADKRKGVLIICQREGISLEEGAAVGNSKEDIPMLELFPQSFLKEIHNIDC